MAKCRSCGRPIVWAKTLAGRSMPVDTDPDPEGNLLLVEVDEDVKAVISISGLTEEARQAAQRVGVVLRTSHFATCPDATMWRRERGGRGDQRRADER